MQPGSTTEILIMLDEAKAIKEKIECTIMQLQVERDGLKARTRDLRLNLRVLSSCESLIVSLDEYSAIKKEIMKNMNRIKEINLSLESNKFQLNSHKHKITQLESVANSRLNNVLEFPDVKSGRNNQGEG